MNPKQSNNPYSRVNFDGRARATGQTLAEHIEEEEFIARILAEQAAQTQNLTTVAQAAAGGGAGGTPPRGFFQPNMNIHFSISPTTSSAPTTFAVNNDSSPDVIQFCNITWGNGDGTTSTGITPAVHLYNTGTFNVSMTASSIYNGATSYYGPVAFLGSNPSVVAGFGTSSLTPTGPAPLTVTFVNTSSNTSQTPTSTFLWLFGAGSLTGTGSAQASSSAVNPTFTFLQTGSYTIVMQMTGSYPWLATNAQTSSTTRTAYISASVP